MSHRRTLSVLGLLAAIIVPTAIAVLLTTSTASAAIKAFGILCCGAAIVWTSIKIAWGFERSLAEAIVRAGKTAEVQPQNFTSLAEGFQQLASLQERVDQRFAKQRQLHARTERDLGTSASLLQTAYASLTDAVLVVDRLDRLVLQNPASETLLGLRANHLNRPLVETLRVPQLHDLISKAKVTRQTSRGQIDLTRLNRNALAVVSPLPDPPGGAVLVIQDETELRRLERMRRDFVSNVSHELKTPLTSIQAFADTLRDGGLDDRIMAEMFLDRIIIQANRLNSMIVDMLDLARLESDPILVQPAPYSAASFARHATATHLPIATGRGLELTADVQDGAVLTCDQTTVRTIVDNLIKNAVEHTPSGGTVRFSINDHIPDEHLARYAERANHDLPDSGNTTEIPLVCIHVEDTGEGIPRDHIERIFERFFRVDRSRNHEIGGSGLGLSIVKHSAERLGGHVSVESKLGVGSTFHATVPGRIVGTESTVAPASG